MKGLQPTAAVTCREIPRITIARALDVAQLLAFLQAPSRRPIKAMETAVEDIERT